MFKLHSYGDHKSEDVKPNIDIKISEISVKKRGPPEDKLKEKSRIRQLAFKSREKMPKDYKSFCLVTAHLARNAHRYYKESEQSLPQEFISEVTAKSKNVTTQPKQENQNVTDGMSDKCKDINKMLREIRTLKKQNRIIEQQDMVLKPKSWKEVT